MICHYPNHLSVDIRSQLLNYAIVHQSEFVPTTTATNATGYRHSVVLHDLREWRDRVLTIVESKLPEVCDRTGISRFKPSQIEMQLTAHRNGGFYRVHNDNGSLESSNRMLTFVMYFWQEPKMFAGGSLRFDNAEIEPGNGDIVFFPSGLVHEVTIVNVDNDRFENARFTVNGWVRS